MPRIDPLQLLNCLNVLLTPSGGIKSEQEVARISSLMEKFSKKLVSKCVYLLILKSSDIHLLSKFMGLGGWNLIYNWLLHAVEAKNYPFLIELLEVIIICPVDIERLKSNPMPRQIKFLSKDATVDSRVRDLASDIVKHWLAIVKGTPASPVPVNDGVTEKQDVGAASTTQQTVESAVPVSTAENAITEQRVSSDGSNGEMDDANYVKSTSPSTSSAESDESDVFVPYKKASVKNKNKVATTNEKMSTKRSGQEEKPKLKSKLIQNADSRDPKKASIKLRIEKKTDRSPELKSKKDDKTLEEKLKEKRKLKEEKEKEKFAKYKQEREKKEKLGKERRSSTTDSKSGKEKSQDDKLKGDLSKLIPRSLDKLGRIPKKPKESDAAVEDKQSQQRKDDAKEKGKVDEKKNVRKEEKPTTPKSKENEKEAKKEKEKDSKKTTAAPPKKPVSMSVEKRFAAEAKPKTVKAYNSKFRLTGLEQESTPKPPARKSSSSSGNPSSGSSKDKSGVKRSPTKDVEGEPAEKKLKSPDVSITEDKNSPVAAKVKKPFLQESDVFMNAMNVALETQKESLRKRKKPTQKPDAETKAEESATKKSADAASSPTPKSEKDVKPSFKFYKDTLDLVNDENNSESAKEDVDPLRCNDSNNETEDEYKDVKINVDSDQPRSADGLKSSLSIFRMKKHPKKSVRWKRDDELEAIQYFEVDATERTNVVRTFWDMQMMERSKERESLLQARKNADNDKMAVQTKWKPLMPIDIPPSTTVRGANSQEKNIQYARERSVPPAIYFNKSMIPDTPSEPDLEIHPVTVPPVIPLDDISGSQDSINDFSTYRWPEPKQFPADNGDMSMMAPGFVPNAGMPPPMFPPFPDGTFPPPFGQPFFPGGPVGPMPVPPSNWPTGNNDQNQQNQNSMPMNWPPPNVVPPPVGPPGMIGPPPFGMMAPPFPPIPGPGFPGAPPNMFPPANVNQQQMPNTSPTSDNQQYSNSNYSNSSESNKKWNNDDRYYRKDGWKNNYSDRGGRDKRGSSNWRGSGNNSRLCRIFQKKGYCNVNGCRFYHPEK